MNKDDLNYLLNIIENPAIGNALLTTFHKLNYCGYKKHCVQLAEGQIAILYLI